MATYDLSEFLEDDDVVLEGIRSDAHPDGKAYLFASPSFEVGLWLKNLIEFGRKAQLREATGRKLNAAESAKLAKELAGDIGKLVLDDDEEMDLYRRVMGDTLDEMRADGVKWESVQRIYVLLLKKWGNSQPIEVTLEEGKGSAPNRETRRAAAKKAPAKATPAKRSSRQAGSKSSRARTAAKKAPASSATRRRTTAQASTRESATSASEATPQAV